MKLSIKEIRKIVQGELARSYLHGVMTEGVITTPEGKKAIKLEIPRGQREVAGLVNLVRDILPKMPGAEDEFEQAMEGVERGEYMPLLQLLRDYLVMKTKTRVIMPVMV
jgi:hypothetical protein